ncbi:MAG: hypothetical protein KBB01_00515 [Candidatus Omnitrophica bacterium]|jgi:Flp pilus assembly pilin Flp|nr:hypothetical protein [Candidatus Omnitrophota bacterium]
MKSQSTIEYAILVVMIIVSILGIAKYIQRAVSARVENVRQDLNENMQ